MNDFVSLLKSGNIFSARIINTKHFLVKNPFRVGVEVYTEEATRETFGYCTG